MDKEQLIRKWLNDELTPHEMDAFNALQDASFYKDIVKNANHFKASSVSKIESFETLQAKLKTRNHKSVKPLWSHPLLRIASMLVITFGIYFTFFYKPSSEVKTLAHQKTTIQLPDASSVTLNALSFIEFNKSDWNEHRKVNLDGEAFFKVQKGKSFDVITTDGIVTVVGTEFSVKQRNEYFEVQCYEGVVSVVTEKARDTLTAGQTYRLLNGTHTSNTIEHTVPSWLDNKSSFHAIPFKQVVDELERQYDVEVQFENVLIDPIFTGGFLHNNLDNALMSITQPLNLTYKVISPRQVVIYGQKK